MQAFGSAKHAGIPYDAGVRCGRVGGTDAEHFELYANEHGARVAGLIKSNVIHFGVL